MPEMNRQNALPKTVMFNETAKYDESHRGNHHVKRAYPASLDMPFYVNKNEAVFILSK
jgi:hypothetical protein